MATPPLICDTIQFEGAIFQRCNLQVVQGTTVIRDISFCDTDILLDEYSSFSGCIYPNSTLVLTADGLNDVSFVLIKATYPSSLLTASKFINIIYQGAYLPMSNLTILTGNAGALLGGTWDLDPNGSDIESPFFNNGGMLLYNPHNVRINVEVILGSGIITPGNSELLTTENGYLIVNENQDYLIL